MKFKLNQDLVTRYKEFMLKTKRNFRKAGKKLSQTSKNFTRNRRLKKDIAARKRAERLAKLPKSRIRRWLYYLHPVRFFKFWFSKRGLILGLKLMGIGFAAMIFLVISLFAYYRREIDADPKKLQAALIAQTTKFYDKTGTHVIYSLHGDTDRTWAELENISENLQQATIAIEDKDFYSHGGFSITGVARAVFKNIFNSGSGYTQGGSTITQQFVKNAFLSTEKTITRKIKELILSLEMERLYTKDEILEFYLNQIPYGGTEYGAEAASEGFFGKSSENLLLDEAALLAALPQAPTRLSPYGDHLEELTARQELILRLMVEQDYITADQALAALEVDTLAKIIPPEQKNQFKDLIAPHFVVEVQKQLEELFQDKDFVLNGGLKVITSLDYDLQFAANQAVKENIHTVERPANGFGHGDNAALVAIDVATGQVAAMVGSRDYNYPGYGAFNAALSLRQPGSSFKPYDYSALFAYTDRWGPDSQIYDTDTTFTGGYHPENFDFRYKGKMTVRQAIGESRNIPAVKAMYIAGIDNVLDLARAMGNKSLGSTGYLGLSSAIGAGEVRLVEHTSGYSTLARGGEYLPPAYILKVENAGGDVLYEWEVPEPERVLDPQVAYLMTDILKDDSSRTGTFGRNNTRMVVPGLTHTVKTGTTNKSVDGWMLGYSRYYAVGVWVGNHDSVPMRSSTNWQTGPIFVQFMKDAHANLPDLPIYDAAPAGIKTVRMDSISGYAATDASTQTRIGYFPSWYVPQVAPGGGIAYTIDKISGNLATDCTPELARQAVEGSRNWPELLPDDPSFGAWALHGGYWSTGAAPSVVDSVHSCDDIKPIVDIVSSESLGSGNYKIRTAVTAGTHPVDKLEFYVAGTLISTQDISASGTYYFTGNAGTGVGEVRFTARVIDGVLYYTEDHEDIDTGNLALTIDDMGGGSVEFTWSNLVGATDYKLCYTPRLPQVCTADNSPEVESLIIGTEYEAYIEAYSGASLIFTSATKTFTPAL